jgi:hypothetical protein
LVSAWIRAAFPKLATAGIKATLTSKLGAGFASFNVSELGGFAASDVGLATNGGSTSFVGVTWNAAAGDQVLFGGAPKWPLSRLAASLALSPAQAQAKSATTVAGALAQVLSCDDVATLLTRSTGGTAYSDCGSACIRSLCERALDLMWTRAAYTPDDPTLVEFAAMATASVSDDAHPSTFAGTWVGSVRIGDDTDKIGGTAQGKP